MREVPVTIGEQSQTSELDPRFEFVKDVHLIGEKEIELWQPRQDHVQDPASIPQMLPQGFVRDVLIANEVGPCGGVNLALNAIKEATDRGRRVRSPHLPVHNARAVASFPDAEFGISMEDWQEEGSPDTTWIGPAHGESLSTSRRALKIANVLGAESVNVTCPLVKHTWDKIVSAKNYIENAGQSAEELVVIFFGQEGHDEQVETKRVADENGVENFITIPPQKEAADSLIDQHTESLQGKTVTFVGQTTNNDSLTEVTAQYMTETLRSRSDLNVSIPDELTYSAENVCKTVRYRLEAVRKAFEIDERWKDIKGPEVLIVIGSRDSKNTQSIAKEALEVAKTIVKKGGEPSLETVIVVSSVTQLDNLKELFKGKNILISSGASATNEDVEEVTDYLNPDPFGFYKIGPTNNTDNSFYPIALDENPHQSKLRQTILEKNIGSELGAKSRELLKKYASYDEIKLSDIWASILSAHADSSIRLALETLEKLEIADEEVTVPLVCLLAREASYVINFYPLLYRTVKEQNDVDTDLYGLLLNNEPIVEYLKQFFDSEVVDRASVQMVNLLHRAMAELWNYPRFIEADVDIPSTTDRDVTVRVIY